MQIKGMFIFKIHSGNTCFMCNLAARYCDKMNEWCKSFLHTPSAWTCIKDCVIFLLRNCHLGITKSLFWELDLDSKSGRPVIPHLNLPFTKFHHFEPSLTVKTLKIPIGVLSFETIVMSLVHKCATKYVQIETYYVASLLAVLSLFKVKLMSFY